MQIANLEGVDQVITRWEYQLVRQLFVEDKTPYEASLVSAQSQMRVFTACELALNVVLIGPVTPGKLGGRQRAASSANVANVVVPREQAAILWPERPHRREGNVPTHKTRDTDARTLNPEVAMALRILDGSNASKSFLNRYFALRAAYDRDVWRRVITTLADRRS